MVRSSRLLATVSLCAAPLAAQQPATRPAPPAQQPAPAPARVPQFPRAAASSRATVEVLLSHRMIGGEWTATGAITGPARIRIDYGQPHLRGRALGVGDLVPMDSVWRLGANMATELRTEVDITLGDKFIPRGLYSLFVLPTRGGWKLIVNRQLLEWGTEYDASQDVARIDLRNRTRTEPLESLSIYLEPVIDATPAAGPAPVPTMPHGTLRIIWSTMELSTDWRVGR